MDERTLELKRLKRASGQMRRKYVAGWKGAAILFLVLALLLTPVSIDAQTFDNKAADIFGGSFWQLKNRDENAVFVPEQEPSLETDEQIYAQLQSEAVVLLSNENSALPLQEQTLVSCFFDSNVNPEKATHLQNVLAEYGIGAGNGAGTAVALLTQADQALFRDLAQRKAAGTIEKILLLWDTPMPAQPEIPADCKVDAVLWTGGADAKVIAEILTGAAPSGALPYTGAYATSKSPVGSVYTGYKYYETRYEDFVTGNGNPGSFSYWEQVAYPFGYGLSYTSFAYSDMQVAYDGQKDDFVITVTVTNTGSVAARETAQVYAQAPYTDYDKENGVEKPAVKLVGFAKTGLLEPGAGETLTLTVEKREMASFDAKGAGSYILDAGDYYLTLAADSHKAINNILAAKGYTPEGTENRMDAAGSPDLTFLWVQSSLDTESYRGKTASRLAGGQTGVSRKDWEGTLSQTPPAPAQTQWQYNPGDYPTASMPTMGAENGLRLYDMVGLPFDDPAWQTLLDQLTFRDMVSLVGDAYGFIMPAQTVQAHGDRWEELELPVEGAFLSAAFNTDLMYAAGWRAAETSLSEGKSVLSCPGASFEDSFLAGKMQAAQVNGIMHRGVTAVLNGQSAGEWQNEQAVREQYLSALRYVVEQQPTAGVAVSDGAGIADILRQEWDSKGMLVGADIPAAEGLLSGITAFNGWMPKTEKELASFRQDPVVVTALRQACHHNLYVVANSAAMNGIGDQTVVKARQLSLVTVCFAAAALCWVLCGVFGVMWLRGSRKWKKTVEYLDYKTLKNTLKQEKEAKK